MYSVLASEASHLTLSAIWRLERDLATSTSSDYHFALQARFACQLSADFPRSHFLIREVASVASALRTSYIPEFDIISVFISM